MVITQLEELEKAKIRVYIDYNYAFLLYRKDIEVYSLQEGDDISEKVFEQIIEETVYRRSKQKALAILKFKDRTEQELRGKLSDTGYPEEVINRTIAYVTEYGYLNDTRYVTAFIRDRKNIKSKMVIKTQLLQKGAQKELIERILKEEYTFSESEVDPELQAIKKAVSKKTKNLDLLNIEEKQKLMASLYRKGFSFDNIKQTLK